jgi:hypothetical protein
MVVYSKIGGQMNPEVPERERTPVPKRRWKPLNEPERRTSELDLAFAMSVAGPSYDMQSHWSGH